MKHIFLSLLLIAGAASANAQGAVSNPIPLKDEKPYYERAFATSLNRSDAFYAAKLFFAEYFKRSKPETIIDDREGGRLSVKTCLFYHFVDNPETYKNRLLSLTDISFRNDSCIVRLYDWQVQRAGHNVKWVATPQGFMPEGTPVWNNKNLAMLLMDAIKGKRAALREVEALDKEVVKMLDGLQKKISAK